MKITVLTDNISRDSLKSEWGLSFYIEFNGKKYLLDTGASEAFLDNASKLGLDMADIDCAVISHAHYDHSLGLEAFVRANAKSVIHISANAKENCYAGLYCISRYIGLPKGFLKTHSERIQTNDGFSCIGDNVFLVSHDTPGLAALGRRNHLFVKKGFRYVPDDFSHEQSLVFRTDKGLVIFNSCSHSGPDVVCSEVRKAFPGEIIYAYLGGLHLFRLNDRELADVTRRVIDSGIEHIYTGHCTGQHPYEILKEHLGNRIEQFYCGMEIIL